MWVMLKCREFKLQRGKVVIFMIVLCFNAEKLSFRVAKVVILIVVFRWDLRDFLFIKTKEVEEMWV